MEGVSLGGHVSSPGPEGIRTGCPARVARDHPSPSHVGGVASVGGRSLLGGGGARLLGHQFGNGSLGTAGGPRLPLHRGWGCGKERGTVRRCGLPPMVGVAKGVWRGVWLLL